VTVEASPPLSLDIVRARIFYLACDVETVSAPAAMLLRAVADAIEESNLRIADDDTNGHGAAFLAQAARLREISQRSAETGRHLGIVTSHADEKR
jgi:hypothetical protein